MQQNKPNTNLGLLKVRHANLLQRLNQPLEDSNGIFLRYKNPVITTDHVSFSSSLFHQNFLSSMMHTIRITSEM